MDASVLLPVLVPRAGDARTTRVVDALRDPAIDVVVPPLIDLEILNVGARRHGLREPDLMRLVRKLEELAVTRIDPRLDDVARWSGRGLSAYDATYAALAEELDAPLLTHDREIHAALPERAISSFAG